MRMQYSQVLHSKRMSALHHNDGERGAYMGAAASAQSHSSPS